MAGTSLRAAPQTRLITDHGGDDIMSIQTLAFWQTSLKSGIYKRARAFISWKSLRFTSAGAGEGEICSAFLLRDAENGRRSCEHQKHPQHPPVSLLTARETHNHQSHIFPLDAPGIGLFTSCNFFSFGKIASAKCQLPPIHVLQCHARWAGE